MAYVFLTRRVHQPRAVRCWEIVFETANLLVLLW